MTRLTAALKEITQDTMSTYWVLLKVMVPVMIAVRLAAEFGAISILAEMFAPVMAWVGLPGEMGVVWVTAMLINIYAGMVAMMGLMGETSLTVAQVTVLSTMILIAHSLPVEQRIVQLAGPNLVFTTILRIASALLLGAILNWTYLALDTLQEPAELILLPTTDLNQSWADWGIDSLKSLVTILIILFVLLCALRILEATGVVAWLNKQLTPVLRLIGIGGEAAPVTMTGLLLGLSYGGAVMLRQVAKGEMNRRDLFLSLSLLCLCHSLIEDTLLVMAMGGDLSGILVARVIFSLIVVALLAVIVHRLPDPILNRYLCGAVRV